LRRVLDLDPELLLPLVVDRFGASQKAAVDLVAEQVVAGPADGSVREVDPHLAALCVLLTVQSFLFSARIVEAERAGGAVGDELRRLLDGYLR
ncbi:MAG: transcriptional regulator, TetR family, partial [Frankiales bacterium]|nr:transcriptional regulator, TetR family [Frankiales bacterium]